MLKEKYILADMQIIEFENEDVITTSSGETKPEEETTVPQKFASLNDNEVEIFVIWEIKIE